jgi:YgiT-type zinc finger domain-containing protein
MEKTMICDICGQKGIRIRRITRSYGKNETLLVIENIPVMSCPHCGESYLTAETLYELERIKLHRQSFSVKRPVAVAPFLASDQQVLTGQVSTRA